ncbi:MAG: NAD(P)H-dependent oxidoreductase subunit E [Planctomycetota bacterium]
MSEPTAIAAVLQRAIRDEEAANAFYQSIERKASNPTVKLLFLQLARDELQHKSFLEQCQTDPVLLAKLPTCIDFGVSSTVPEPDPSQDLKPADAIALAMKREQRAMDLYRTLADATQDPALRATLAGLARMEQEHKRRLEEAFVSIGYPESFSVETKPAVTPTPVSARTTDPTTVLQRHVGAGPDQLIPILQDMQASGGYLSRPALIAIAKHLRLPLSRVYGVATFYNQFRYDPPGKYHVQVCRGTACHVRGSAPLLEAVQHELAVEAGHTTADGTFSVEVVACVGACGLAPVMVVGGDMHANVAPPALKKLFSLYRRKA